MNQPAQQQEPPGRTGEMNPRPDHGEESYRGSGRLAGKAAVITGADSGIGRAVAIAFAREGADVLISYLDDHNDARETARWVEQAGRKAVLVPGDPADAQHCRAVIDAAALTGGIAYPVPRLVSSRPGQPPRIRLKPRRPGSRAWHYPICLFLRRPERGRPALAGGRT